MTDLCLFGNHLWLLDLSRSKLKSWLKYVLPLYFNNVMCFHGAFWICTKTINAMQGQFLKLVPVEQVLSKRWKCLEICRCFWPFTTFSELQCSEFEPLHTYLLCQSSELILYKDLELWSEELREAGEVLNYVFFIKAAHKGCHVRLLPTLFLRLHHP